MQAICKATGMSTDTLNKKLKVGGDLGDVAIQERKHQNNLASMIKSKGPPPALTIKGVYEYALAMLCYLSLSMCQAACPTISPTISYDVQM